MLHGPRATANNLSALKPGKMFLPPLFLGKVRLDNDWDGAAWLHLQGGHMGSCLGVFVQPLAVINLARHSTATRQHAL